MKKECSVEGCCGEQSAKGWCQMHYSSLRNKGKACVVTGCGRDIHRREWCNTHYVRWRKTGDVQAEKPILAIGEQAVALNIAASFPIGTETMTASGYVVEKLSKSDPMFVMANQTGRKDRVLKHRLVMARSIGRPLTDKETVHHINAIRDDNRIENLELWENRHPRGARQKDPHCKTCTCKTSVGEPSEDHA